VSAAARTSVDTLVDHLATYSAHFHVHDFAGLNLENVKNREVECIFFVFVLLILVLRITLHKTLVALVKETAGGRVIGAQPVSTVRAFFGVHQRMSALLAEMPTAVRARQGVVGHRCFALCAVQVGVHSEKN